jgi:hypothetical protein
VSSERREVRKHVDVRGWDLKGGWALSLCEHLGHVNSESQRADGRPEMPEAYVQMIGVESLL